MTWLRVSRLGTLSRDEWRELMLACAWQLRLRVILFRNRDAIARLTALAERQRAPAVHPLPAASVDRLARWSGVICGGSCLTTAFVHQIMAARHGVRRPVTIGVALDGSALHAHAWAGEDPSGVRFTSVWTNARGPRR